MRERVWLVASWLIIGMTALVLVTYSWWMLQPANLPTVTQPLPVLNPNREIAVGDPIVLEVAVVKTVPRDAEDSDRWLECGGGNLVTLTSTATTIPVGTNTLISDSIILPNKVTPGDVCTVHWAVTYHINYVRDETLRIVSEPFTVIE